ncbi:nitroreductase family protein [Candidatus Pacearchaeota archaeon]|nr:nitroreductase family protein [Candidatus Pacearchaeota archaeon]
MEFDFVVKKRNSTRSFKNKKASWKDILEAIDAANQGPFAGNQNDLKFLIVEGKEAIKDIAEICEQDWIKDAGIIVLICSDEKNLENMYGERGRVYSRQQAGAAIQTMLLKLTEMGLDSCWVGAYSDVSLKEKLKIPSHIQIEAAIPIGYAKEHEKKKSKNKLEHSLYWEFWGEDKRQKHHEIEREIDKKV